MKYIDRSRTPYISILRVGNWQIQLDQGFVVSLTVLGTTKCDIWADSVVGKRDTCLTLVTQGQKGENYEHEAGGSEITKVLALLYPRDPPVLSHFNLRYAVIVTDDHSYLSADSMSLV